MNPQSLVPGDVLFKQFHGGGVHIMINLLTAREGLASRYCHAAMYIGNGEIAESSGGGYRIAKLNGKGVNFTYEAFRHKDSNLAEIAAAVIATWVKMRPEHKQHIPEYTGGKGFGQYALGTAVSSALKNWVSRNLRPALDEGEKLWGSNGKPGQSASYCSQFVVQAYLAAGATYGPPVIPIDLKAKRATPGALYNEMMRDPAWQHKGTFVSY